MKLQAHLDTDTQPSEGVFRSVMCIEETVRCMYELQRVFDGMWKE